MSLINQMLRDLERRQSSPVAAGHGVMTDLSSVESRLPGEQVSARWMLLPVAVGLFVVVGAYFAPHDRRAAPMVVAAAERIAQTVSRAQPDLTPRLASASRERRDSPAPRVASTERTPAATLSLSMAGALSTRGGEVDPTGSGLDLALLDEAARFDAMLSAHPPAAGTSAAPAAAAPALAESATTALRGEVAKSESRRPLESVVEVMRVEQSTSERARAMLRKGLTLVGEGRVTEGERHLYEALSLEPTLDEAREVLASRLVRYGRGEEALRLIEAPDRGSPKTATLRKLEARVLTDAGRIEEALDRLGGEAPALDADLEFHAIRAALLQRAQRHQEAATLYRALLERRPSQGLWWMGLAISLDAAGNGDDAFAAYRRALDLGGLPEAAAGFVGKRLRQMSG